jgi:hypothetical protein
MREKLGLLFDFDDFAALIIPALRTSPMRHLLLVAVRTLGKRVLGK